MKTFRSAAVLATLTVSLAAAHAQPTITQQPLDQTMTNGGTVVFNVSASGAGPFTYQWQLNGTNLPTACITTVAGNGTYGYSGDGGQATNAQLYQTYGVALDTFGNLFIAESLRIRKVGTSGVISTVAGNGIQGYSGDGGAATSAELDAAYGVALDGVGDIFIADYWNMCVRKVDTNGIITTVAGNGSDSFSGDGGQATNAGLGFVYGVALDSAGNLFIGAPVRVRKVTTNGIITTVAGNGTNGFSGDGGQATNAELSQAYSVAVDSAGNLFIADYFNNRIRKVGTNGIITTIAGNGTNGYSGDGGAATNASLKLPSGVALDHAGNLFIADSRNERIREVGANGIITTVAGNGTLGYSGDGGAATNAEFHFPYGLALDTFGNLFIADMGNYGVRKVLGTRSYLPMLTLYAVSNANAGNYSAVINDSSGSITSRVAALTVIFPFRTAIGTADLTNDSVVGINVLVSGSCYTNTPLVRIIGGGGSGAQAVAVVSNGVVTAINVLNAGSGYTNTPLVVVEPPFILNPVLGITPMSFLSFSNLTVGGAYQMQQSLAWYWTNQPFSFTATDGLYTQMVAGVWDSGDFRMALNPVPAQAFATPEVVYGFVVHATVTSGGSGYVTSPAVSIVGGGGTNATAVSKISASGVVTNIAITDAGIGYTSAPTIEIAPPPAAAVFPTVQPVMRVDSANLAPYDNYQIQFKPHISGAWANWNGGLFTPTGVTNSQFLFITNGTGFFRLLYQP